MATGIKELAIGRSDVYRIDPRNLTIKEGWNSRTVNFDPNDADDLALAQSISEVGVKQPLTIFYEDGQAFVSDGHRRLGATMHAIEHMGAEIKSVPAQMEDRYASEAERVFSQIVRNSGKPLAPIEQAKVFKRLVDLGWKESEIAAKSGLNVAWVKGLLDLHAAPAKLTKFVKSGQVSATLALKTLKDSKGDANAAADLLGDAVETAEKQGKTRATAKHVKKAEPEPAAAPEADPLDDLGPSLQDQIKVLLAEAETRTNADTGRCAIVFTSYQYAQFKALLGL